MADISDVVNGMVTAIASSIYPNGISQASTTGTATKIYGGWPVPAQLDQDLAAGKVHISIYPLPAERLESLINLDTVQMSVQSPGTTLTITGNQITVGGTPKVGDVACVNINRNPYAYAVLSTDTTATIASSLASMIGGSVSGSVITVPSSTFMVSVLVSTPGTVLQPMRRVQRNIQIACWAPTPQAADATAKAVDTALWTDERLAMPDGTACGLVYVARPVNDMLQKTQIYRRDVIIQAQFVEAFTETAQTVADVTLGVSTPAVSAVNFNIGT